MSLETTHHDRDSTNVFETLFKSFEVLEINVNDDFCANSLRNEF